MADPPNPPMTPVRPVRQPELMQRAAPRPAPLSGHRARLSLQPGPEAVPPVPQQEQGE